jgi:hypothetical protein
VGDDIFDARKKATIAVNTTTVGDRAIRKNAPCRTDFLGACDQIRHEDVPRQSLRV